MASSSTSHSSSSSSSSSAPPPITTTNSGEDDDGLVPGEEKAVRAWLVQQGFEPGDLRSAKKIEYHMMTPMAQGCRKGELNVCKWLYNHGAGADISRANNYSDTPMLYACMNGYLSVCEWLYKVGANEDISRRTPSATLP